MDPRDGSGEGAESVLRRCFPSASQATIAKLARHSTRAQLSRGASLRTSAGRIPLITMVDHGVLAVRLGADGPGLMRCVRVLGPGQIHGLCRALCRQSVPTEELRALTEAAIVQADWADLEDSLKRHPGIAADILTAIGRHLALDDYRLARSYCETTTANLAMELLLLHHIFPDERPMDVLSSGFDRSFLADLLGVSRQSTFRALHELREAGLVRTHGRAIEVLDEARLRRLARVDHAPDGVFTWEPPLQRLPR